MRVSEVMLSYGGDGTAQPCAIPLAAHVAQHAVGPAPRVLVLELPPEESARRRLLEASAGSLAGVPALRSLLDDSAGAGFVVRQVPGPTPTGESLGTLAELVVGPGEAPAKPDADLGQAVARAACRVHAELGDVDRALVDEAKTRLRQRVLRLVAAASFGSANATTKHVIE